MMTLAQLMERFPDEETCRAHLLKLRWPGKVSCPRCHATEKVYKSKTAARWTCKNCHKSGYRFSLTTGTIFEDTKYPLRTWFQVLYLMLQSKKGMSALQIHRIIGSGSYETAWYLCHRLRAAMQDPTFIQLTGVVEVDETYIGGKAKNRHGGLRRTKRQHANVTGTKDIKAPVIGAIARKGNVVCRALDRVTRETMHDFVNEVVSNKVSLIATDDHAGYRGLYRYGFQHESVHHAKGEYVRDSVVGAIHTANLDSFWSLVKRGMVGTYHKVSWGYLPMYLNEFSFRHNHRKDPDVFDRVLASC